MSTETATATETPAAAVAETPAKVNKAQIVRDFLAKHPEMTPKQLSAKIKEDTGVEVKNTMISVYKAQAGKSGKKPAKKASKPRKGTKSRPAPAKSVNGNAYEIGADLVAAAGGFDAAAKVLEVLARCSSAFGIEPKSA